jgi:hypothetical protein
MCDNPRSPLSQDKNIRQMGKMEGLWNCTCSILEQDSIQSCSRKKINRRESAQPVEISNSIPRLVPLQYP